jgi:hypothetical protein
MTGGADGMVHLFCLLDLVDQEDAGGNTSNNTITPLRSWSLHHLPVTVLTPLLCGSSYRMATASEDGQINLIDVYQGENAPPLCTFSLPHGIRSLISHVGVSGGQHLLAGSAHGTIYWLDLDLYAIHVTQQQTGGTPVVGTGMRQSSRIGISALWQDQVFGTHPSEVVYQTTLVGHDKAVTALAVVATTNSNHGGFDLISGDESGTMRIWDLDSRVCRRVVRPWAMAERSVATTTTTTSTTTNARQPTLHPVTSIIVWEQDGDHNEEASKSASLLLGSSRPGGGKARHSGAGSSLIHLVTPLQRFRKESGDNMMTPVPFLQPSRHVVNDNMNPLGLWWNEDDWQIPASLLTSASSGPLKKRKLDGTLEHGGKTEEESANANTSGLNAQDDNAHGIATNDAKELLQAERDRVLLLQQELEEAKSTIQRWEVVNNKLMTKLQQQQQ